MGRTRSERTGGIWHMSPQQGELTQSEIEFFKEELKEVEPNDVAELIDSAAMPE